MSIVPAKSPQNSRIAVIGLGYVGLPLAVEFGKKFAVVGYDIDTGRVNSLREGLDKTCEISEDELVEAKYLQITDKFSDLGEIGYYIITVPTPVDEANNPDMSFVLSATKMVGKALKPGDIVIYESTVYPGATEEECVPILELNSGLKFNLDFFCGYSPERINPGDKDHKIKSVVKITSGSTPEAAEKIDLLYRQIITAGTHRAASIQIAEAAKIIENTQRDINIALVNELAMVFNKMNIDTSAVLDAASTKWNFFPFKPGLVGGHCIGVDPYYLMYKAQKSGYIPEIMIAGRRINDGMAAYVASQLVKAMIKNGTPLVGAKVLILGFTFKENCPDVRNTKIIDVCRELKLFECDVCVYDPWVSQADIKDEYDTNLIKKPIPNHYDGILLAVAHDIFLEMGAKNIRKFGKAKAIVYDVKNILDEAEADLRL